MSSKKESQLSTKAAFTSTDLVTGLSSNTNVNFSYSALYDAFSGLNSFNQVGNPLSVPVLEQPTSGVNNIRNMESGAGVIFSVSAQNGIKAKWNITQNGTGIPLIDNVDAVKPTVSSLVAGTGTTITKTADAITFNTEVEGIDVASAGDVYIADGVGGGSWLTAESIGAGAAPAGAELISDGAGNLSFARHQGWGQFQDTDTTVGTPSQNIAAAARTLWTNDGGALTIEKNPTDLTVPFWSTSANKIQPIAAFDIYQVRIGFTAENYAGSTPYITIELDIGGGIGTIYETNIALRKSGVAQGVVVAFPVFAGSTFLANGGEVYLTYQGTGACDIYKSSVLIVRESKNFV